MPMERAYQEAVKDGSDARSLTVRRQIGEKLLAFFDAFSDKLRQLGKTTHCTCDASVNIDGLRLKAILHTGTAAFYKIGGFTELSGFDVIIVHWLLKNSVKLHEYILMTEAAIQAIPIPSQVEAQQLEKTYPAIGMLRTYLYPIHHPTSPPNITVSGSPKVTSRAAVSRCSRSATRVGRARITLEPGKVQDRRLCSSRQQTSLPNIVYDSVQRYDRL